MIVLIAAGFVSALFVALLCWARSAARSPLFDEQPKAEYLRRRIYERRFAEPKDIPFLQCQPEFDARLSDNELDRRHVIGFFKGVEIRTRAENFSRAKNEKAAL